MHPWLDLKKGQFILVEKRHRFQVVKTLSWFLHVSSCLTQQKSYKQVFSLQSGIDVDDMASFMGPHKELEKYW